MALQLGCHPYHRTLEQGEKEETLAAWIDGAEQVVVATTALSTGVDVAGVGLVVHLNIILRTHCGYLFEGCMGKY
jgi:superfamily II DNA helicase RecQ